MKTKIALLSLFVLFISCTKGGIYNKTDDNFDNNRWEMKDVKSHNFSITDETKLYDILIVFSHVYDYQFSSVPLKISITSPEGSTKDEIINLKIKDDSGVELSDCGGDFCDLSHTYKSKTKLTKGNYKITISHDFKEASYLPNVLGIGLFVDDNEK